MKRRSVKMPAEKRVEKPIQMDKTVARRQALLVSVANAYFLEGLAKKDFSAIPYDDNVTVRGPLAPGGFPVPWVGKETLRKLWWPLMVRSLERMGGVRIVEHYVNEEMTGIMTEAEITLLKPPVTLLVAARLTVNAAGKIIELENHFDPRDLTSPPASNLIVRSYFDGLANKDLSAVPYARDATLRSPLNPNGGLDAPLSGKANILALLDTLLPRLGKVEVVRTYVEEEWVAAQANVEFGTESPAMLRVVDCFRIKDGEIVEQESHYDPRPALLARP